MSTDFVGVKDKIVEGIYDSLEATNKNSSISIKTITEIFKEKMVDTNSLKKNSLSALNDINEKIKESLEKYQKSVINATLELAEELKLSFKKIDKMSGMRKEKCGCTIDAAEINKCVIEGNFVAENGKLKIICEKCRRCIDPKVIGKKLNAESLKKLRSDLVLLDCFYCGKKCFKEMPCGCIICYKCVFKDIAISTKRLCENKGKDNSIEIPDFKCPSCSEKLKLSDLYNIVDDIDILSHILRVYSLKSLFPGKLKKQEYCCMKCFKNFNIEEAKSECIHQVYCRNCYGASKCKKCKK